MGPNSFISIGAMVRESADADPSHWANILGTQSRGLQGARPYPASSSPKPEQSMHFETEKATMVWWHKRRVALGYLCCVLQL